MSDIDSRLMFNLCYSSSSVPNATVFWGTTLSPVPGPNEFFSTRLLGCRLGHVSTVKSAKGIRNCYNAISREINWDVLFVQILWGILRFSAVLVFINTSSPRI